MDEFERRFAQKVADEARRLAEAKQAKRLIVVAEKRMLGFLREAFTHSLKTGMEIEELAKDLSKLSLAALQDHLAGENLLPPRTRGTISPR